MVPCSPVNSDTARGERPEPQRRSAGPNTIFQITSNTDRMQPSARKGSSKSRENSRYENRGKRGTRQTDGAAAWWSRRGGARVGREKKNPTRHWRGCPRHFDHPGRYSRPRSLWSQIVALLLKLAVPPDRVPVVIRQKKKSLRVARDRAHSAESPRRQSPARRMSSRSPREHTAIGCPPARRQSAPR